MILVVFALPPFIGSYVKMGRNFTREAEDLRIELERWDQLHWIQDDKIYQKLNSFYQISKLMNSVNTLPFIHHANWYKLVKTSKNNNQLPGRAGLRGRSQS